MSSHLKELPWIVIRSKLCWIGRSQLQ
uniref:Uncharacterized protein n=1 Tax=Arundo donax TaxID=35708 RepID=A0A0A8YKS9_ARUDO